MKTNWRDKWMWQRVIYPLMQAQASALSSEQLQDVALFYSQQVTPNLSAN